MSCTCFISFEHQRREQMTIPHLHSLLSAARVCGGATLGSNAGGDCFCVAPATQQHERRQLRQQSTLALRTRRSQQSQRARRAVCMCSRFCPGRPSPQRPPRTPRCAHLQQHHYVRRWRTCHCFAANVPKWGSGFALMKNMDEFVSTPAFAMLSVPLVECLDQQLSA